MSIFNEEELEKMVEREVRAYIERQRDWAVRKEVDDLVRRSLALDGEPTRIRNLIDREVEKRVEEAMPEFTEKYMEELSEKVASKLARKVSDNILNTLGYLLTSNEEDEEDDE